MGKKNKGLTQIAIGDLIFNLIEIRNLTKELQGVETESTKDLVQLISVNAENALKIIESNSKKQKNVKLWKKEKTQE